MPLSSEKEKLWEIFHPYGWEQELLAKSENIRFAHYTSAEAAIKILHQSKCLWLRKANCMRDFSEVEHGLDSILETYNHSNEGARLRATLNELFDGFTSRVEHHFNSWIPSIRANTYIGCFSVHRPEDDTFGRLSLWRAYAANSGVAIILHFSSSTVLANNLKVYTNPVAYITRDEFQTKFDRVTDNIQANINFIKEQGSSNIEAHVFDLLRYAAVSVKNPCFAEEKEWRLIYSPDMDKSEQLQKSIEIINEVPQVVFSIPLYGLPELDFPSLLDRIIIGPTQYPFPIAQALVDALRALGVQDPASKVHYSKIPPR
jgi:Protein of unknown function (DUF2971)